MVAPETGVYKIDVYKASAAESFNWLGLAWTRDATCLPDIRSSYDGWESDILIRNDSAKPDVARIGVLLRCA